jgi:hypothetical protein
MKHLIKKHRFFIISFSLLIFLMSVLSLMLAQFPADAVIVKTGVTCSIVDAKTMQTMCIPDSEGTDTCMIGNSCPVNGVPTGTTTVSVPPLATKKCFICKYQEHSDCFSATTEQSCKDMVPSGVYNNQHECSWAKNENGDMACMSMFELSCLDKKRAYPDNYFDWSDISPISSGKTIPPKDCTSIQESTEEHSGPANCENYLSGVNACIQGLPEGATGSFIHNGCSTFKNKDDVMFYIENNIVPNVPKGCTYSVSGNQTYSSDNCQTKMTITFTCQGITGVKYDACHKTGKIYSDNICLKNDAVVSCAATDGSVQKEICCVTDQLYKDNSAGYISRWYPGTVCPSPNAYPTDESQLSQVPIIQAPAKPIVNNIVPAEIPQEKPTTLTIVGNNFTEESKVVINGKVLPINMQESTPKALSVDIPRAALPEGSHTVKVINPGFKDNLGFSNPKPIAVVKKLSPALLQNPVLKVGAIGVATQLLNIRSDHSAKATVLSKLAVDETATITAGPIISDGYVWWQVSSPKVPSGWVAEKVVVNSGDLGSTTVDQEAFFIANKPKPGPTITKDQLVSCEGKDVGGVCRSSSNDCTDGVIKGPGNPGGPYPDNKPARPFDDCKAKGMPVCCKTNNSPNKCEASPNNGTCKKTSNDCSNGVIAGLNGPFDDCKAKGMSVCCKPKSTAKTCAELASVGKQCVFLKDCKGGTQTYPKPSDCNAVDKDCCIPKSITSSSIDTSSTTSSSKNSVQIKCSDYQEDFISEEKQKNWSCKSSVDCLASKGSVLNVDTDCKEKNMICCGSGK